MKKIITVMLVAVCLAYSATNDTTIDSATLKRIFMGNYAYSTIVSSSPILTMRWANDLNRPVFKNRTGTAYKMLSDASTSSNTPSTRLFYADATGAAGSSANLTFDGTKLNITGKLMVSDSMTSGSVIASTIRSTNTISAAGSISGYNVQASNNILGVGGNFSGRITATDVQVTDSIIGLYIFSQGLSAQYVSGNTVDAIGFMTSGTGFYSGGMIESGVRLKSPDLEVRDSVIAVTGTFSGALTGTDFRASDSVKTAHLKASFSASVDSGGYYTGPEALNHQWWIGAHAVAYNNGPNQFRIDGPKSGAAFRIDSSGVDSSIVIANDTVKIIKSDLKVGNEHHKGVITTDTLKAEVAVTKKQIELGPMQTITLSAASSYNLNVDTLETNFIKVSTSGGGSWGNINISGTRGTSITLWVNVTSSGYITYASGSFELSGARCYKIIMGESNNAFIFTSDNQAY